MQVKAKKAKKTSERPIFSKQADSNCEKLAMTSGWSQLMNWSREGLLALNINWMLKIAMTNKLLPKKVLLIILPIHKIKPFNSSKFARQSR